MDVGRRRHPAPAIPGLAALCLSLLLARGAIAQTWSVKQAVRSPLNDLPNFRGDPTDKENAGCTSPGTCTPYAFTLPNNTLWWWCGWVTEKTTNYKVRVSGPSVTSLLMREKELNECVLGPEDGLKNIKGCEQVWSSRCTGRACNVTTFALAFPDDACFLVANNDNSRHANITIQLYQESSSPRYYGAVFSIILTILTLSAFLVSMVLNCKHEWTSSHDRVSELRKLEDQAAKKLAAMAGETGEGSRRGGRDSSNENGDADGQAARAHGEETDGPEGAFRSRVKDAMVKVRRAFKRKGDGHQQ